MMKQDVKSRKFKASLLFFAFLFIALAVYVFFILLPLIWGFYTSFKTSAQFMDDVLLPTLKPTLNNYSEAFEAFFVTIQTTKGSKVFKIHQMFLNSLLYALGGAAASALMTCVAAYLVAKFPYKFSKIVYGAVIVAMILPIVGALPSQLRLTKAIGVHDSMVGMWVFHANFLNIYFLVFYATFKTVAKDYAEAASIDGASNFTVLTRLMIPLVKNTLFIVMLLQFIALWNDYQTPMLFLPSKPTVAYGMYLFAFAGGGSSKNVETIKITGGFLLLLPILVLYLAFNKKLVGNLTMGGIKG